ncbi:MAG TPA: apolipoprotein N-acyltransferase [Stellaceae bacterium]|nr:apolipoprotein N-acyltransferase [Stellaceae bacterium]
MNDLQEVSALRVRPGARLVTPLCRIAQEMASLAGWRRYLTALALGALLAAGLPPVDMTPVIFVVFPLYLWLDEGGATPWAAARLGYVFGLGYFTAGLYWVAVALFVDIARYWWALPFGLLGLPVLLSVFVALGTYAAGLARLRLGATGLARICAFAVTWAIAEWLRGHVLTGFPWNLVGYVWAGGFPGALAMLQTTAWVGIYGLSFLTVLAACLPALFGAPSLTPLSPARRYLPGIAAAALILVPAGAGALRLSLLPSVTTDTWLRLVQPSISQTNKWNAAEAEANFHRLTELSTAPADHRLAAVIWPEAAATYLLERDAGHRDAIAAVVPPDGYVLTGALRGPPLPLAVTAVWNSIDAIDGSGRMSAQYDKAHLVPFGEYMPLSNWLPIKKFTPGVIDLSAGPGPRTLALGNLPPFSPLICYEAIFPGAVLDSHDRPAWILNVSNDAWYGRSAGPYQHFAMARTRAVEEGLPLIRVANNGITGVVDAQGRVLAHTNLDAIGHADVALPAAGSVTPYGRFGDWLFLILLLAGSAIAHGSTFLRRPR